MENTLAHVRSHMRQSVDEAAARMKAVLETADAAAVAQKEEAARVVAVIRESEDSALKRIESSTQDVLRAIRSEARPRMSTEQGNDGVTNKDRSTWLPQIVAAVVTAVATFAGVSSGFSGASDVLKEIETPRMESAVFSLWLLANFQNRYEDAMATWSKLCDSSARRRPAKRIFYSWVSRFTEMREGTRAAAVCWQPIAAGHGDASHPAHQLATIYAEVAAYCRPDEQEAIRDSLQLAMHNYETMSAAEMAASASSVPRRRWFSLGSRKPVFSATKIDYEPRVISRRVLNSFAMASLLLEPVMRAPGVSRQVRRAALHAGEIRIQLLCIAAVIAAATEWSLVDHALAVLEAYARICEYERTFALIKESQRAILETEAKRLEKELTEHKASDKA